MLLGEGKDSVTVHSDTQNARKPLSLLSINLFCPAANMDLLVIFDFSNEDLRGNKIRAGGLLSFDENGCFQSFLFFFFFFLAMCCALSIYTMTMCVCHGDVYVMEVFC